MSIVSEVIISYYTGCINVSQKLRCCFSACGTFVFAGSEDGVCCVWNAETGDPVASYSEVSANRSIVTSVDFHPTDNVIAITSEEAIVANAPLLLYAYDPSLFLFSVPIKNQLPSPIKSKNKQNKARMQTVLMKLDSVLDESNALYSRKEESWEPQFTPLKSVNEELTPRERMKSEREGKVHIMNESDKPEFQFISSPRKRAKCEPRGVADGGMDEAALPYEFLQEAKLVVALYDYQAERSDELSFQRGDQIRVMFRDSLNWSTGVLIVSGKQGYFLNSYVTDPEVGQEAMNQPELSALTEPLRELTVAEKATRSTKELSRSIQSAKSSQETFHNRPRKVSRPLPVPNHVIEEVELQNL
ncbi:Jouberin [Cichlidogyrus casuarinus]|uniref:Jouberin n=1 Tax=Cichlidogyrus casuarinus TaxID=1844966 RepID=A0ABD2PY48_9PLAT